jgi:hypothetical protein
MDQRVLPRLVRSASTKTGYRFVKRWSQSDYGHTRPAAATASVGEH